MHQTAAVGGGGGSGQKLQNVGGGNGHKSPPNSTSKALPSGPGPLGRSATVADLPSARVSYQQQGHELLYRMDSMQSSKLSAATELERKRAELSAKTASN